MNASRDVRAGPSETQPGPHAATPGEIVAFGVMYGMLISFCVYLILKNDPDREEREMERDMDEPSPPVPTPSRPAKRKPRPLPQEQSEACVDEIKGFLRAGVPGMRELAKAYPGLRARYHADDPQGWADSCNAAFCGYGRDIQRRLEECGWELDKMDPCELWFVY